MSKKEKYNKLVKIITLFGEKFRKKHGNYIKLNYFNDFYFCMDSWNENITIIKNPIYIDINNGFKGEVVMESLGTNFGGFELHISEDLLDFYLDNLIDFMKERGYDLWFVHL